MKTAIAAALLTSLSAFASVGEDRRVDGFEGLSIANAIEATITQGDAAKVRVTADSEDTLKKVVTEVKDGTLKVRLDGSCFFRCEVKLAVVTPRLSRLELSGASKAKVDGTFGPRLELGASGASKASVRGLKAAAVKALASGASELELAGQTTALELDLSGASELAADKFTAQSVKAELSGASDAALRAEKSIEAELSGASSLAVRGKPAQRKVETSGASDVSWKD